MAYIYRHIKPDGEVFYIGIAKLKTRPYSKINRNKWWHNIVNKYGYEVQILKSDLIWEDACELERILISYYGRKDLDLGNLVNLTDGGEGVLGLKGNIGHTGKKHTEETKKIISIKKQGISPGNKGMFHTEEARKKMSKPKSNTDNMKGKIRSREHIEKHRNSIIGRNTRNDKIILNTETGIFYMTIVDAARSCNIRANTLQNYLLGNRKNITMFIRI